MRIVVAPDSFKECLDAVSVSRILFEALAERFPGAEIRCLPLADGGEGTAEILSASLGAEKVPVTVTGPLGDPVHACFWKKDDQVLLDIASACGLGLVPRERRNPLLTSSVGVGELLKAALESGAKRLLVGLGGSSTCDGGAGMLSVPGLRERASGACMTVLCDVDNPFLGERGAARVFGPQKGASPEQVELLEERMRVQARILLEETGTDVSALPGAGAAGGLGGALAACFGAALVPGIDTVLDVLGFEDALSGADLVITGEGRSDRQTLAGKVPYGVLKRAGSIPVALVSGQIRDAEALRNAGFRKLVQVTPEHIPLPDALRPEIAAHYLKQAVSRL